MMSMQQGGGRALLLVVRRFRLWGCTLTCTHALFPRVRDVSCRVCSAPSGGYPHAWRSASHIATHLTMLLLTPACPPLSRATNTAQTPSIPWHSSPSVLRLLIPQPSLAQPPAFPNRRIFGTLRNPITVGQRPKSPIAVVSQGRECAPFTVFYKEPRLALLELVCGATSH